MRIDGLAISSERNENLLKQKRRISAMAIFLKLELKQEKIFQNYKAECIVAAKELHYSDEVLEKIRNSKTEPELIRIMINARHAIPDPPASRKLHLSLKKL